MSFILEKLKVKSLYYGVFSFQYEMNNIYV